MSLGAAGLGSNVSCCGGEPKGKIKIQALARPKLSRCVVALTCIPDKQSASAEVSPNAPSPPNCKTAPSFDHGWHVAGARGENKKGPKAGRECFRVVFAREDEHVTTEFEEDPVAPVINTIPLLPPPDRGAADGISYWLRVESQPIQGAIRFSNPWHPALIALESAVFHLAEQIAPPTGLLRDVVNRWRRYVREQ